MTDVRETNWYFTEFIKTLIVLSLPAKEQFDACGAGDIGYELYRDFKDYYSELKDTYLKNEQILPEHAVCLNDLEALLNVKDKTWFEDNDILEQDHHWKLIRKQAKKCLKALKMDHLGVEATIISEPSVEEDGTEVIFQIVQLDLIDKRK